MSGSTDLTHETSFFEPLHPGFTHHGQELCLPSILCASA
jgi:hypothetical protein